MFTQEFEKVADFKSADQANGDYQPKFTRDDKRSTMDTDIPEGKSGNKYKKKKKPQDPTLKKADNGEDKNPHVSDEYPAYPGDKKEATTGNVYNQNSVL